MKALFVCAGEGDKVCLLSLTLLFPSISSYLDKADWFLKADDDTYVIVENLRLLLSRFSPDKPVYLGRRFRRFVHQGYMSGGAGYVLSRESVRRYVRALHHGTCTQSTSAEDLLLGFCLQKLGVPAGDSRDHQHRETFHPLWLGKLLCTEDILPKWFHQYNYYPSKVVSKSSLSVEHISNDLPSVPLSFLLICFFPFFLTLSGSRLLLQFICILPLR